MLNVNFTLQEIFDKMPYLKILLPVILVLIVVLVIAIIVVSKKKKNNMTEEDSDKELVKKTIKEDAKQAKKAEKKTVKTEVDKQDEVKEEPVVEEVKEEKAPVEVVEEEVLDDVKEDTFEEEVKTEEPVVEEEKTEEPVVEEEKPKAPEKKSQNKKATKVEEEKVETEEVKAEEPVKKQRVVNGKYEVYFDGSEYFYVLKASNGEPLIRSESYGSKDGVLAAIAAIKRNVEAGTIRISADKRGVYQFSLVAKNHRTLVVSANYDTEKRAISASESFKRFAVSSPIVEIAEQVESQKEEIVINCTDKKGGKIGVIVNDDGTFCYLLKASNGEVLVHSENYKTQLSAEKGLEKFKESIGNGKFYVVKDKRGYFQFKLFSATGRIVAMGESYPSKAQAISSANSLVSFVALATPIEE